MSDVVKVPKFHDGKGKLLKLQKRDFPTDKKGRMAFCDYMVEVYQARKATVASGQDERDRLKIRIEREEAKLELLKDEMERMN